MTSHELARQLLAGPDLPVALTVACELYKQFQSDKAFLGEIAVWLSRHARTMQLAGSSGDIYDAVDALNRAAGLQSEVDPSTSD